MSTTSVGTTARCLRQHPDWVEAWFGLSGDQRVSEGWYLARDDSSCVLGRIPGGPKTYFDDCSVACAEFVKLFAEIWRIGAFEEH